MTITDPAILYSSMILHRAGIWRRVDGPLEWIVEAILALRMDEVLMKADEILHCFWTK